MPLPSLEVFECPEVELAQALGASAYQMKHWLAGKGKGGLESIGLLSIARESKEDFKLRKGLKRKRT